jgi:hypothetical protein
MDKVLELRAQRKALELELETTEREHVAEIPTGRKIGQVWSELQPSERRAWLKRRGIRVYLTKAAVAVEMPHEEPTPVLRGYDDGQNTVGTLAERMNDFRPDIVGHVDL